MKLRNHAAAAAFGAHDCGWRAEKNVAAVEADGFAHFGQGAADEGAADAMDDEGVPGPGEDFQEQKRGDETGEGDAGSGTRMDERINPGKVADREWNGDEHDAENKRSAGVHEIRLNELKLTDAALELNPFLRRELHAGRNVVEEQPSQVHGGIPMSMAVQGRPLQDEHSALRGRRERESYGRSIQHLRKNQSRSSPGPCMGEGRVRFGGISFVC